MNEEQLVQLGVDAEVLLNTEAFNRTINSLVDSSVQEFLGSAPDEEDKRSNAYYHYRALVDIVNTLRQQAEVRDQINSKQDEPTTEEEE
jgi:hypothetical protein